MRVGRESSSKNKRDTVCDFFLSYAGIETTHNKETNPYLKSRFAECCERLMTKLTPHEVFSLFVAITGHLEIDDSAKLPRVLANVPKEKSLAAALMLMCGFHEAAASVSVIAHEGGNKSERAMRDAVHWARKLTENRHMRDNLGKAIT